MTQPVRPGPAREGPTATCLDLPVLLADGAGWDALVADALDAHPYYTRRVLAAHEAAGLAQGVRCLVAERDGRTLGLLPFRPAAAWVGFARGNVAWSSPFTTASAPLVSAQDTREGVSALLDGMAAQPSAVWLFPALTVDDLLGTEMLRQIAGRGWPAALLDPFDRPVLARAARIEGSRPLRDLTRRRRKLAELGPVSLQVTVEGEGLADALGRFLHLEKSGWKGRRGTALASRPGTRVLAERLLDGRGGPLTLRIDELRQADEVIASSVALQAGPTAFLWKTAYDERYARFAPGLLLEEAIAAKAARTGFAARLNSATGPGTPLDRLFPDRERVADLAVLTRSGQEARLARLLAAERARRRLAVAARRIRDALRRRSRD